MGVDLPVRRIEDANLYTLYQAMVAEMDARAPTAKAAEQSDKLVNWCLVYTAPLAERLAEKFLKRAGYIVFIPHWTQRLRLRRGPGKGKVLERIVPLFRNYVFAGKTKLIFTEIEEAKGVAEVVRIADVPVIIPQSLINDLERAINAGCFVEDERTGWARRVKPGTPKEQLARFRVGQPAQIIDGPFVELSAHIAEPPKHEEILLEIVIFGRITRAHLPLDAVQPLT